MSLREMCPCEMCPARCERCQWWPKSDSARLRPGEVTPSSCRTRTTSWGAGTQLQCDSGTSSATQGHSPWPGRCETPGCDSSQGWGRCKDLIPKDPVGISKYPQPCPTPTRGWVCEKPPPPTSDLTLAPVPE